MVELELQIRLLSPCTEQLAGKISMVVFDTVRASASAVEAAGDR